MKYMSTRLILIIVAIVAVLAGIGFYFVSANLNQPQDQNNGPITLTVWGLWEPTELLDSAIRQYQAENPNITIDYVFQNSLNYRTRLQTQLGDGSGPDVFMIHNTWTPMLLKNNDLSALPATVMTPAEYGTTFYPIAKENFSVGNNIYALPMTVDGLALYYNEDLLKAAGVAVPTTWAEFATAAKQLTVIDPTDNQIKTAGAALGTANNVDHWSDILGLLYKQQLIQYPSEDISRPNTLKGAEVLQFYTQFAADPNFKVWSSSLENSTQAFYSGKLAFYFGPSWRALEIRTANPNLKFKVAPAPQLSAHQVNWASYWAFAVSSRSANQQAAWQFLKYMTSAEVEQLLYRQASEVRLYGQPYSRIDLRDEVLPDPLMGAFLAQGPTYSSWYLASFTKDQGINDEMIKYFEDAVNKTLAGTDPKTALDTTAKGIQQTLEKYGVTTAP